MRPTNDVDIVLHIETSRGVPAKAATALETLGYRLQDRIDPRDNTAHRWVRDGQVVDVGGSQEGDADNDQHQDDDQQHEQQDEQRQRRQQENIMSTYSRPTTRHLVSLSGCAAATWCPSKAGHRR